MFLSHANRKQDKLGFLGEISKKCVLMSCLFCYLSATPEPGEDPRVTRAKYFIRDEFLVSIFFHSILLT